MKCFKLEKTNMSSMPSPGVLSKNNGIEEFRRQINRLYTKETEKEFKDIANIIYKKLENESLDNKWKSKEYREFKKVFSKIGPNEMKYISSSIKKCLESTNKEILEELNKFSNVTSWYPIIERKNIEGNNSYTYEKKKIEISDCFYIINNLMLYIYRYMYRYSEELINQSEETNDINITEETKKIFLENLDREFKYIKEYPLFNEVFIKMKKDSFNILENNIINIIRTTTRRNSIRENYFSSSRYTKQTTNLRKYSKNYTRGV